MRHPHATRRGRFRTLIAHSAMIWNPNTPQIGKHLTPGAEHHSPEAEHPPRIRSRRQFSCVLGALATRGALAARCAQWLAPWLLMGLTSSVALAHGGSLDKWGGHFQGETGNYHYHKPRLNIGKKKAEHLVWETFAKSGVVKGYLAGIKRPDAIWVSIPYRPAYQELIRHISPENRDDKKAMIRVWLKHVSPEASISRGKRYDKWFHKKVMYELNRKLGKNPLLVHFDIIKTARRPRGMVFIGKENINLWVVLSGWSYYVLDHGDNPHAKLFIQAEDLARKNRAGLWKNGK